MPAKAHLVPDLPPAKHVAVGECDLAYFTLGKTTDTPLVLCHGLAATGLQFVKDAHWFAEQGFYVIVPDIRGHGRSLLSGEPDATSFSVPTLAADMLAILDAEQIDAVHWVGNSLGGIIGLELLGAAPERITSFISFGTSYQLGVHPFIVAISGFIARLAGRNTIASIMAPMTCKGAEGQAVIAAMLKQVSLEAAEAIGRQVHDYNLIDNALGYGKPILMLRCNLDKQVNRALKSTLEAMTPLENFSRVDIKDAGHCGNLDQPALVRGAMLHFLKKQNDAR